MLFDGTRWDEIIATQFVRLTPTYIQISTHLSLLTEEGSQTEPLRTPLASRFWRGEDAGKGNSEEMKLGLENCPVMSMQLARQAVLSYL